MLWRGKVTISGNLSEQPFSRGSGRITLKTAHKNIFIPENPQILGCRFLNALVLIRGFLLYFINDFKAKTVWWRSELSSY